MILWGNAKEASNSQKQQTWVNPDGALEVCFLCYGHAINLECYIISILKCGIKCWSFWLSTQYYYLPKYSEIRVRKGTHFLVCFQYCIRSVWK